MSMSKQRQLHPLVVIEQQLFTRDKKVFFRQFPVNKAHKKWRLIAMLKGTTLDAPIRQRICSAIEIIESTPRNYTMKQKIKMIYELVMELGEVELKDTSNNSDSIVIELPEL